jgi:kynurenine formamidase
MDAPSHFIENGATVDEIPLDRFMGTAKLYRSTKAPTGQEISLDDVTASGFELEENQIFVIETGIGKYAETARYNEQFPVPADDLLDFLIDKKIKAYMTDATAVDAVNSETSAKHKVLLGAGIPIVENLRNLHQLPENRPFFISALPLRLAGREGSPCRAVALPQIEALQ